MTQQRFRSVDDFETRRNFEEAENQLNKGLIDLIIFKPQAAPATSPIPPTEGYTYYDKDLKKVRTWDGTQWRDHW